MDALTALINNTYRVEFLEGLDVLGNHFQQCIALAKQVKASHLVRPENFPVENLVEYVLNDLFP
jgi:hypothetical protein